MSRLQDSALERVYAALLRLELNGGHLQFEIESNALNHLVTHHRADHRIGDTGIPTGGIEDRSLVCELSGEHSL